MHWWLDYSEEPEREIMNPLTRYAFPKNPFALNLSRCMHAHVLRQARHERRFGLMRVGSIILLPLGLMCTLPTQADGLGRLFFTPAQRTQLNQHHPLHSIPSITSTAPTTASEDETDNQRTLTVNGIVQKTGGKRIVWINGTPRSMGSDSGSTPESVTVTLPDQSKTVHLKVGQHTPLPSLPIPKTTQPATSNDD
jgi:hypothetical protein